MLNVLLLVVMMMRLRCRRRLLRRPDGGTWISMPGFVALPRLLKRLSSLPLPLADCWRTWRIGSMAGELSGLGGLADLADSSLTNYGRGLWRTPGGLWRTLVDSGKALVDSGELGGLGLDPSWQG
eukprot:gene9125-biopygen1859